MIRRSVMAALAIGIAAVNDDAARRALRGGDVVARMRARRSMERALIDAALACSNAGVNHPTPVHVMRLAALATAGRASDHVADLAAVASAYAALPVATLPRFPLLTLLTGLALAAVLASIAVTIAWWPGPPARTYARSYGAPAATAYATGGVPLRDAALDRLLDGPLTSLAVAGAPAARGEGDLAAATAITAVQDPPG